MQDGAHFVGWQIHIGPTVIRNYEAVPVAVPLHHPFDFLVKIFFLILFFCGILDTITFFS
jgi:hypothetical protein